MTRRLEWAFLVGIVLLSFALCMSGLFFYDYPAIALSFPLGIAGVLVILCLLRLAQSLRNDCAADPKAHSESFFVPLTRAAWIIAAPLAMILLGYALGLATLGAIYARWHGSRIWVSGLFGIALLMTVHLLFGDLVGLHRIGLPGWWQYLVPM